MAGCSDLFFEVFTFFFFFAKNYFGTYTTASRRLGVVNGRI